MANKITLSEIYAASRIVIKIIQLQYFAEELETLKSGRLVKNKSKLNLLCPILIDGATSVGGRLHHAPVSYHAIHPLLIPNEHSIKTLLICHHHEILGHTGQEHILSVFRQTS